MFHPYEIEELTDDGIIFSRFPDINTPMDFYEVVKIDLINIKECILTVESTFKQKANDPTHYYNIKDNGNQTKKVLYADRMLKVWHYHNTYPQFVRYSFFTGIYSLFEERFINLCYRYAYRFKKGSIISFDDFKKTKKFDGIFLAKLYCEEILYIKVDKDMWNTLTYHNQIRNCIVHSRGYTLKTFYKTNKRNKHRLDTAIKKVDGVYTDDDLIRINNTACLNFIQLAQKFIKSLCKQIPLD
ncbi:hypothetical protein CON64_05350 [Bacillus pseudomycoides]|nr:hypothetical protein CON64_05350 [Bacillus pseudomycoides]